jgi:hypothetical protein
MSSLAILQILLVLTLVGCGRVSSVSPTPSATQRVMVTTTTGELPTPELQPSLTPTSTTLVEPAGRPERIVVSGVSVRYQDAIVLKGGTTLPDGSCILTQLIEDDSLVDWWPSQTCAEAQNSGWLLVVDLASEDVPQELSEELEYAVIAWSEEDPEIESEPFHFNLQPPPTPED